MPLTTVSQGLLSTDAQYTGFKNRLINGDMQIDQRNAGASTAPTDAYTLDRWEVREDTDGAVTCQQVADAPAGFVYSAKITTTTADASLTGTQRLFFRQPIEGNNVADLAFGTASAATFTLSFWVKSSLTGTFGGAFSNQSSVRSYAFTYTISAANTWEYKTVTVAGDTSGTWQTGTNTGLNVFFALGMGPDYSGAAGSWVTATRLSVTGAVSVIGTLNATWQVTGVQLEKGSVATSFDVLPYGTELELCKRYYQTITGIQATSAGAVITTSLYAAFVYPVEMRATPTFSLSGQLSFDLVYVDTYTQSSAAVDTNSSATNNKGCFINYNNFSGLTFNRTYCQSQNNRTTNLSAEL